MSLISQDYGAQQTPGIYIVMTDIDEAQSDEFNRWYDNEHLGDVVSRPGVLSGMRYFADTGRDTDTMQGWPQYVAMYELQHCSVIGHPSFGLLDTRPSEWSLRMSPQVIGRNVQRYLAQLRYNGVQNPPGQARCQAYPPQLVIERGDRGLSVNDLETLYAAAKNNFVRYYRVFEGNVSYLLMYAPTRLPDCIEPYLQDQIPGSPCIYRAGKVIIDANR